jgi:hypothetical protein
LRRIIRQRSAGTGSLSSSVITSSAQTLPPTLLLGDFHNSDVVSLSFHPSPLYPHLLLTGFLLVLFILNCWFEF